MFKIIGIILIIYGMGGITGTFIMRGSFNTPIKDLRNLLKAISEKLGEGSESVKKAGAIISDNGKTFWENVAAKLNEIAAKIDDLSTGFGQVAGNSNSALEKLGDIKESIGTVQREIRSVPLVGDTLSNEFGRIGEKISDIGNLMGDVNTTVDSIKTQLDEASNGLGSIEQFIKDTSLPNTDLMTKELNTLGDKMQEAKGAVNEISTSNLLSLVPTFVSAYFGFIHLAFMLVGIALLGVSN